MSKPVRQPINAYTAGRRERLAKAQDGMCPACKLPLPEDLAETEIDHIIPRARGGPNLRWNKQLVHFACNRSKWTRLTPEAEVLAAKHGVRLHVPLGDSHIADRPLRRSESLWWDYLDELYRAPAEERERVARKYFDEIRESA